MAAPAVSGISGLIIEQYRTSYGSDPLPSTVKALLIQTAVDLDDSTVYYNPGPDYASGYGRVDAQAAVDEIIAWRVREDQVSHGQTDSFTFDVPSGTPSFKVTLVWDDEPGAVNASPALVNNLDLVLVEPNGTTTHLPWVLDPANPSNNATTGTDSVNNVEQVQVVNPLTGTWEARVIGTSLPAGPQQYSLVGQSGGSAPSSIYLPLIIKNGTSTPQPPPSGPTPGFWRTDSQGVEFYVTPDRASVANFAAYITVSGCGDYKITRTPLEPISNDQFSFSGSFYASGAFSSETAASGTTGLDSFFISGCGFVSGGPWSWDATWRSPVSVEPVNGQTGQHSFFGATRSAPPTSD
jgi:hypothetical protein